MWSALKYIRFFHYQPHFPNITLEISMRNYSIAPQEIFLSLWHHRSLIASMIRREVSGRYRGSVMGLLWSFFNPLFMLAVYTFVFGVVFKARWGDSSGSRLEFALILFAGLIVFNFFAECLNRAPTLILSNVNYVKRVVFPLEILPWVSLGATLFHALISLAVWLVAHLIIFKTVYLSTLLLPLIWIPLLLFTMGLSWALASLGVYLRDVPHIVGILTTVLMFLSPIFYSANMLPESYQRWLLLNPLNPIIEQTRNALLEGKMPDPIVLTIATLVASVICWLGFVWFQKSRKGFADVL